jgi:hypothetical protein
MSCDCDFFNFGDEVRNTQNPHLTGVVIGDRNWGSEYLVRLADGATTIWWHGIEIEHDQEGEPPAKEDDDTNVVKVDFTQRRAMTAETTTEGAA